MSRYIEPMGNYVLIQPQAVADRTSGGIILAETYKQPPGEGIIVQIGRGRLRPDGGRTPIDLAVGDHVTFKWIQAVPVHLDGIEFKLLDAEEVLGVIRTKPAMEKAA